MAPGYNVHDYVQDDWFKQSSNIKAIISTVSGAAVLELLMRKTEEICQ
jgi:hypothetical protein